MMTAIAIATATVTMATTTTMAMETMPMKGQVLTIVAGAQTTINMRCVEARRMWLSTQTITYPISTPMLVLRSVPYVQYYCLHIDIRTSGLLQKIFQ